MLCYNNIHHVVAGTRSMKGPQIKGKRLGNIVNQINGYVGFGNGRVGNV